MNKSKTAFFSLIFLFMIVGYYFATNPFQYRVHECSKSELALKQKLVVNRYFPDTYEIIFKGQIYPLGSCRHDETISCSNRVDNYEVDRIEFDPIKLSLEHHWERYDSGEYVFDKTQIIKTKMQDFYSCE
ncbi:MAG: hypothetical protein ISP77_01260 [Methylophilaceae bacterium]|nr:hypothetical protein [Methylophilaceae bacterium]MBL6726452.1 hypothetical protein [Methylophilaceae bacterium]MBL6728616.1 hypothetical protein [Methylophilaceae bacterium]MBL6791559.1 hypothetical protein [Methylophilaceae bacterium]